MKLKPYVIVLVVFLSASLSIAQAQITFEKTFSDAGTAIGHSVRQTTDGGYILFGIDLKLPDYKYSWYLVKTDSLGELQWEKTFGDEYAIEAQTVEQTTDGGYILCSSLGGPFTDSLVLIKTDHLGNQEWFHTYPVDGRSVGRSVQQTQDGGFIVAGYAGMDMHENVYVIKTDPDGTIEWSRTYGGSEGDLGYCVRQTEQGAYMVLGNTYNYGNGGSDVYVLKLASNGDTLWTKTFGTEENEIGVSLALTSDGGFISLGGVIGSDHNMQFYAVKADANGHQMWSRKYGGQWWDFGQSVHQTLDGGYFMAGIFTLANSLSSEMHCIKTNSNGDIIWERGYRNGNVNEAYAAQQTSDAGYVVLGTTAFVIEPMTTTYMYLVKTDSMGNVDDAESPEKEYSFSICPNPFFQSTLFKFDAPLDVEYILELFDAQGKELGEQSGVVHDEIYLERNDLPAGAYFFKITTENGIIGKGKIVAQ